MDQNNKQDILSRYKSGQATADEIKILEDWILLGKDFEIDLTDVELLEDLIALRERTLDAPQTSGKKVWTKLAVAASILLVGCIGLLAYFKTAPNQNHISVVLAQADKLPGKNVATLTLSNGSKLNLIPSQQDVYKDLGVQISNDANGNLVYKIRDEETANPLAFNTITTPRGGTYKIWLPDGSQVWLNAESSLKFPLKFATDERIVELTGEGFFEVARANKIFKVITNGTKVEVLGTHFNVNAYKDEQNCKVTLEEGSVKLWKGKSNVILKPGEQGQTNNTSDEITLNTDVDVVSITAWKNGKFKFKNTDLKNVMRQLERWYDVDVDEGALPTKRFNGTISRDVKLSEVLSMIEVTSDLQFKLEGRKIVMK